MNEQLGELGPTEELKKNHPEFFGHTGQREDEVCVMHVASGKTMSGVTGNNKRIGEQPGMDGRYPVFMKIEGYLKLKK